MKALTQEWVDKAEGDFLTATREARVRKSPNYDAVCFHCQQCVEKYVKAFLQERNQPFRPIHDLIELLELCLLHDGTFELQRELLESLNRYAVLVRYPGESGTKDDAKNALSATKTLRTFIRQKLGL
jgi:HEPN domain-containing protein